MKYAWDDTAPDTAGKGARGAWVPRDQVKRATRVAGPMVRSDLPAYKSPLGTGWIDGRAARREDLKRGDCREVDPSEWTQQRDYGSKTDADAAHERYQRKSGNWD